MIASIEEPAVIESILEHLGHTAERVDPAHPSRAPPQGDFLIWCFAMFVTARAIVQGRAGFGLRRDAPAFPGERGRFTRLNDKGSGRLRQMAASSCRHRPGFSSLQGFRS